MKYGIPNNLLNEVKTRDKLCSYCNKVMIYPYTTTNRKDSATIEHLNENGPFYWNDGLKIEDIVMCCGTCNSSRGKRKILDWFKIKYCIDNNINTFTVSKEVQLHLKKP
jgi:hypothetical protein